jgi:hypothetical protein
LGETFISKELMDATMKFSSLEFKDYEDYVNKYGQIISLGEYGPTFNDTPDLYGKYRQQNLLQKNSKKILDSIKSRKTQTEIHASNSSRVPFDCETGL